MPFITSTESASLVVDGVLLAGTGAAAACLAVTAVIWDPVDAALIERADNAGWDTSLLLPHQNVLWLAINGGLLLTVLVFLLAAVSLGWKIRRRRTRVTASTEIELLENVAAPAGGSGIA